MGRFRTPEIFQDIDEIQVNNKHKPSKADSNKGENLEKKRNEKSAEVNSLRNSKPDTVAPKKSRPDSVEETENKENVKSAKDWGRASNDPRNKS